jgi:dihydrolipoamide dehydrogenase
MASSNHIVIVGAGPGGYVAAIRAAQLGARVTVVERDALGGVCLNSGCIPSKALLSIVELGDKMKKGAELGLVYEGAVGYDLARMVARKNQVVAGLVKGIATLFKSWGIDHIKGTGVLLDARTIQVMTPDGGPQRFSGDAVIVATGSSWPDLPLFPIDGRQILTSKQALDLQETPASVLIVGAGVEGCEFASLFSRLGTHVTMVEMLPRILPQEDEEIAGLLARELKKRQVDVRSGVVVEKLDRNDHTVRATLSDGTIVSAEQVLVSVGRGFHTKEIGLEKIGVRLGCRGEILVDARMQTNVPGVYAIGDVVGKAMLAHVASAQGKVAVETIMGHGRDFDETVIPAGIFTLPEIGRVGLTEQQARELAQRAGDNPDTVVAVGRFRYAGLGKAQATGDTAGLFKIVVEAQTGKVLGAHLIGAHATDLIHEIALAMQAGATVHHLASMIHAHPTLAEGIMEAAEDVEGLAIHASKKRGP